MEVNWKKILHISSCGRVLAIGIFSDYLQGYVMVTGLQITYGLGLFWKKAQFGPFYMSLESLERENRVLSFLLVSIGQVIILESEFISSDLFRSCQTQTQLLRFLVETQWKIFH